MKDLDIGIIGLGVMGQNLALNIADKGFSVGGWDAWPDPVERLAAKAATGRVHAFKALPELLAVLRRPRRLIMLVKAGEVVDQTIAALRPLLAEGDMLVDGGNEYFRNTERRAAELAAARHPLLRHGRVGRRGGRAPRPVADAGRRARRLRRHGADPDQDRRAGRGRTVRHLHAARAAPATT